MINYQDSIKLWQEVQSKYLYMEAMFAGIQQHIKYKNYRQKL